MGGQTSDKWDEGAIMINRKIKLSVFELNANTLLCTPDAMKVFSQSKLSILYHHMAKN